MNKFKTIFIKSKDLLLVLNKVNAKELKKNKGILLNKDILLKNILL